MRVRWLLVAAVLLSGCAASLPELRGLHANLRERLHEAKELGGMQCAPAELAGAQAAYRFATLEIDQGNLGRAAEHVDEGLELAAQVIERGPRCPVRGAKQVDWSTDPWPDADGDAVPDADDRCPWTLEDLDGFQDGDGCAELDNDVDGLADTVDACPNEPEDVDSFEDEDGCPEPDNDRDGLLDASDDCPLAAETKNGFRDADGCPDVNTDLLNIEPEQVTFAASLEFVDESPVLLPQSFVPLRELARVLKEQGDVRLRVDGHTADVGAVTDLLALSHSRALSVMEFLVAEGVERARLSAQGFGAEQPIDTNRTASGRARNERIVLTVLDGTLRLPGG